MGKEAKTNAMRILERAKVAYTAHEYPHEEGVAVDGVTVAASIGEDPACVYKTLVTQGNSKNYFVFVIPVAAELDLKAAARSVGEKSVAMIHVADINKVTGYAATWIMATLFSPTLRAAAFRSSSAATGMTNTK